MFGAANAAIPFSRTSLRRSFDALGSVRPEPLPDHAAHGQPAPVDPPDVERVEHGEHVAAEALHRVGAFGHAGAAVAASVIAHEAKVLRERRNLAIPHVERGAERIRQHEYGRAFGALDFDVDRTTVGADDGHGDSFGDVARDTF
jgi:hypothetical protein